MSNYLYDVGDQIGLEITFLDAVGAPTDPTTVTFRLTPPTGAALAYTYGVDVQLTKVGTGHYAVDYQVVAPGVYDYGFTGVGVVNQTEEAQLYVREPLAPVTRGRGYTTPRLVGGYLGRTLDGPQSIQAEVVIAAVENWIDHKLGRSWAGVSPTTERHLLLSPYVQLNNYPISGITSVAAQWTPLAPVTVLAPAEYTIFDAERGVLYIGSSISGAEWQPYRGYMMTIVYTHNGPAVPADVSLAATMIASLWLQPSVGGVDGTVKSYSVGGEESVTFADGVSRSIPPEAMALLGMVPHRLFA